MPSEHVRLNDDAREYLKSLIDIASDEKIADMFSVLFEAKVEISDEHGFVAAMDTPEHSRSLREWLDSLPDNGDE